MATLELQAGATSKILQFILRDPSGALMTGVTSDMVTYTYARNGDLARSYGDCVTASVDTFTSGGFVEVDATYYPGLYQFGVPNNAIATGSPLCKVTLRPKSSVTWPFTPVVENIALKVYDVYSAVRTTYPMIRNSSGAYIPFEMFDTSGARAPGKTISAYRSIDGASTWTAATGTVTEVGSEGAYWFLPSAADLNGSGVMFKFTATGCDPSFGTANPQV